MSAEKLAPIGNCLRVVSGDQYVVCNVRYKYIGVTELIIQVVFVRCLERVLLGFVTNYSAFYGIHSGALIVNIQEYCNKCAVLQYKDFTVETLEFRNVSPLSCGSSSGSVHQYLYTEEIINR